MSIKSAFWAVRYGLSFSDAGILDDVLRDTAGRYVLFSDGSELVTIKRLSNKVPVRGNLHDYVNDSRMVYAISKDSLHLIQSPLLQTILKIILGYNKLHGGKSVSSNAKAWRKDYDQQR